MFALQASTIAVAGFFLTQRIEGVDVKLRSIGATLTLLLGAPVGLLGVPVLASIREYSLAYVARRNPLELELADEIGRPDFRELLAKKHAEQYKVTLGLKAILVVAACLCIAGAVAIWLPAKPA